MEYSGTQRIFVVTVLYNKKDFIVELCIRKEFCRNAVAVYKLVIILFHFLLNEVYVLVNKFWRCSLLWKKQEQLWHILSEETIDDMRWHSEACPQISLMVILANSYQSHVYRQPQNSFFWYCTNVCLCTGPSRQIVLQAYSFITGFVKQFVVVRVDSLLTSFTYEEWFYLNIHINSWNDRHYTADSPIRTHRMPLCDIKVEIWCAISRKISWTYLVFETH
jgi:hypothetical protein